MNSLFAKHKWLKYVAGSAVVALGVLIIILACLELSKIQDVISVVIAIAVMVIGIVFICGNIFQETHKGITASTIVGTFAITLGIVLLVARFAIGQSLAPELLVYFIAISLLVLGVVCVLKAISLIYYHERKFLIVLMFVIATVGIVLGFLGIVFAKKPELIVSAYLVLGIVLVVFGIIGITFAAINERKKTEE